LIRRAKPCDSSNPQDYDEFSHCCNAFVRKSNELLFLKCKVLKAHAFKTLHLNKSWRP